MMDTTIIRVVAGVLFVVVLFFLIQRRRNRVENSRGLSAGKLQGKRC